jgi:hypothetical protein
MIGGATIVIALAMAAVECACTAMLIGPSLGIQNAKTSICRDISRFSLRLDCQWVPVGQTKGTCPKYPA